MAWVFFSLTAMYDTAHTADGSVLYGRRVPVLHSQCYAFPVLVIRVWRGRFILPGSKPTMHARAVVKIDGLAPDAA
jgi:hypothetical protein